MQRKIANKIEVLSGNIDLYGTPVHLNFKGKTTVTSKLGSLFTLLIIGLSLAYLSTLLTKLIQKDDPKINQYKQGMNLFENPTTYNLSANKFSVGFGIFNVSTKKFVQRDIMTQLLITKTIFGTALDEYGFVNAVHPCKISIGDFDEIEFTSQNDTSQINSRQAIESSMCFDIVNATLKSDFDMFGTGVKFYIQSACHLNPKVSQCQDVLKFAEFLIVIVFNQELFVNLDEKEPIKGQLSLVDSFPLSQLNSSLTFTKAYLSLNEVYLTDTTWVNQFNSKPNFITTFFTTEKKMSQSKPDVKWPRYSLQLQLSQNKIKTQRQVYDFFSLLCDIGGFNGTIVMMASLFIKFYNKRLYIYTLVESIFQMDLNKKSTDYFLKKFKSQDRNIDPNKLHDADLVQLIQKVERYLIFKMPFYVLILFGWCPQHSYLTEKDKFQFKQLKKGKKIIEHSLDIQTLIRTTANVHIMMKVLFTKQQRWLINHQRFGNLVFNDESLIRKQQSISISRIAEIVQPKTINRNNLSKLCKLDLKDWKNRKLLGGILDSRTKIEYELNLNQQKNTLVQNHVSLDLQSEIQDEVEKVDLINQLF